MISNGHLFIHLSIIHTACNLKVMAGIIPDKGSPPPGLPACHCSIVSVQSVISLSGISSSVVFLPLMVFVFHAQCAGSPPGVHQNYTPLPPLTPPLPPPRPSPPPHPLSPCWSPGARRERLAPYYSLLLYDPSFQHIDVFVPTPKYSLSFINIPNRSAQDPHKHFLYQRNRIPTEPIIQDVSREAQETRSIAHIPRLRAAKIAGREDGFPGYQRVADAYFKDGCTFHLSARWGGWFERNCETGISARKSESNSSR